MVVAESSMKVKLILALWQRQQKFRDCATRLLSSTPSRLAPSSSAIGR
jgi:hypothetical protein